MIEVGGISLSLTGRKKCMNFNRRCASAYSGQFLGTLARIISAWVPKNCPEYSEAHRLLKFLRFFLPVSDKEIPPTSIMREFVGGSSFKY